jgi:hypothetical protein
MTRLHEWLASQNKRQCDLCGVALALAIMALMLIGVLHLGADE